MSYLQHKVQVTREDKEHELVIWPTWVGKQVRKISGKFKSGESANTVKGTMTHPITARLSFTFIEDDTYVECFRCVLVSDKPSWDSAPDWALGVAVKCYGDPGELGEWCWMSPIGAPGFICFEQRPLSHYKTADARVQAIIDNQLYDKADREAKHREYQRRISLQRQQKERS